MSESKQINQGAVSTLADTDLVMACDSGGTFRPISIGNLKSLINRALGLTKSTEIEVSQGDWVRIARGPIYSSAFAGILFVSHRYDAFMPRGVMISLSGCGTVPNAFNAVNLIPFDVASSVSAVRIVQDGTVPYIEVKFNAGTSRIDMSLCGAFNLTLEPASISNASEANVLKQIALSGG